MSATCPNDNANVKMNPPTTTTHLALAPQFGPASTPPTTPQNCHLPPVPAYHDPCLDSTTTHPTGPHISNSAPHIASWPTMCHRLSPASTPLPTACCRPRHTSTPTTAHPTWLCHLNTSPPHVATYPLPPHAATHAAPQLYHCPPNLAHCHLSPPPHRTAAHPTWLHALPPITTMAHNLSPPTLYLIKLGLHVSPITMPQTYRTLLHICIYLCIYLLLYVFFHIILVLIHILLTT